LATNHGQTINYLAPWNSPKEIPPSSLDLIFSQSVLQYVNLIDQTYSAMAKWLRPGGYASHVINFSAHDLSPFWNGHWAYSDWQWRLARGRREVFLNREPLNTHLTYAKKFGFEVLLLNKHHEIGRLAVTDLSPRFRALEPENLQTSGVVLLLRKRISWRRSA
jgi:hypothetical protein